MRGEHRWCTSNLKTSLGSSPHARGALDAAHTLATFLGIIPACAGSTNG